MAASVAEYLGIAVSSSSPVAPAPAKPNQRVRCPFKDADCDKVARGNKPVCSVRDGSGEVWIVCEHRLCATSPRDSALTDYQRSVLLTIARTIWADDVTPDEVLIRREVPVRTPGRSSSRADYVMIPTDGLQARYRSLGLCPVVLEMQGGGETSNTGDLTQLVDQWENSPSPQTTPSALTTSISSVGSIEANAWRRQQEQFLYKGNVAVNTGGKLVFAVGSKLFDYLMRNLAGFPMQDLRGANWTLAVIGIVEASSSSAHSFGTKSSLQLTVDPERLLFTNYSKFVNALINQGGVDTNLFRGNYISLSGNPFTV